MSSTRPTTEFVPEAQEVVEEFSRRLLELEAAERAGVEEPEALNAAFRAIHSLKGLAALFAAGPIATLSHSLENALDALRLGKVPLNAATLDVLFEAVESFAALLVAHEADAESPSIDPLLARIDSLVGRVRPERTATELPGVDESILGVLTEYELKFTFQDKAHEVKYDASGRVFHLESEDDGPLTVERLPAAVLTHFNANYPNAKILSIGAEDGAGDGVLTEYKLKFELNAQQLEINYSPTGVVRSLEGEDEVDD